MQYFYGFLFIVLLSLQLTAQQTTVPVFISGNEGHKSYRIPAIISLPTGELLAFAEGRVNGASDFGDVNIVLKRSSDQGKTWSSLSTIVDYDQLQAGNPAPVVDVLDPNFPKGRIFLFYNTGNNHEAEVRKGNGIREVWYEISDVHLPGSNESSAAELSDGGLMLNARNQKGDIRSRIVATSKNGGETWDSIYFDPQLPDSVCEGTILNIGKKKGKNVLAFCNAADTKARNNLTLRISYDEGITWALSFPIDKNPENKKSAFTAYSDIVRLSKNKIGVLYERNNYSQIVFRPVKWR